MSLFVHMMVVGDFEEEPTVGPTEPTVVITPGLVAGRVSFNVTATGTGVLLQFHNPFSGWGTLVDPAATGIVLVDLSPTLWGTSITLYVRGVDADGVPGTAFYDTITVPGDTTDVRFLIDDTDENQRLVDDTEETDPLLYYDIEETPVDPPELEFNLAANSQYIPILLGDD